jgi:guanylate kinase
LVLSISATTRPPRPTERPDVDYLFVTDEEFDRMVEAGELLEWEEVFGGHRYGTPQLPVEASLGSGYDVLLEIDVEGARQIRDRVPEAVMVLLRPPSMNELGRRLRGRGTETDESIAERLAKAQRELDQGHLFDHEVLNDDLDHASSQVAAIIEASHVEGSSGVDEDPTEDVPS